MANFRKNDGNQQKMTNFCKNYEKLAKNYDFFGKNDQRPAKNDKQKIRFVED